MRYRRPQWRVLKPTEEERRAPASAVVSPELEVGSLASYPRHDVADAAPSVEALVQQPQLRLPRIEAEETERSG